MKPKMTLNTAKSNHIKLEADNRTNREKQRELAKCQMSCLKRSKRRPGRFQVGKQQAGCLNLNDKFDSSEVCKEA